MCAPYSPDQLVTACFVYSYHRLGGRILCREARQLLRDQHMISRVLRSLRGTISEETVHWTSREIMCVVTWLDWTTVHEMRTRDLIMKTTHSITVLKIAVVTHAAAAHKSIFCCQQQTHSAWYVMYDIGFVTVELTGGMKNVSAKAEEVLCFYDTKIIWHYARISHKYSNI